MARHQLCIIIIIIILFHTIYLFCLLVTAQDHVATLWVGTNAGTVYIHQITLPLSDKRDTEPVQSILGEFVSHWQDG